MEEMSRAWLEEVGWNRARHTLRYFLRQHLQSDGSLKCPAFHYIGGSGFEAELSTYRTNELNLGEVFTRNGLLTKLERGICINKFGNDMNNKELTQTHFYEKSQLNDIVKCALDKILKVVCAE